MNSNFKKATVMAIDDVPANLDLLQEMLRGQGYRVLAFPSGKMAITAALKNPPNIILLDINMPDMNGFEVCERLKANTSLRNIPVLFISALNEEMDKVKAFAVGGVDYVTKPFQFEEVLARVDTHLRLRQLQVDIEEYNLHLEQLVQEKIKEISESQLATIIALSKLASSKDDDVGFHIERTQIFCKMLAEKLQDNPRYACSITNAFVENIYHAAPMHDIGKVGIPDRILLKPSDLTPDEFKIMKTHTIIGAKALQTAHNKYPHNEFINMGIIIARSHHEKWDGSGYPDGLTGEEIPIAARIMAVADVYDALRSKRHYKEPFTHETSCRMIMEGIDNHFDPAVIDAFMSIESEFASVRDQMDNLVVLQSVG